MTRAELPSIAVDVIVASERWRNAAKTEAILRRAVSRAADAALPATGAELAIVLTDDAAIRLLNRDWRGVDAATNVLSFPAKNANRQSIRHLGDVVLAYETIAREARGAKKPFAHHLTHLAVHGFLHLIGYDHERDKDAVAMERRERAILRQLSIPDPYRANFGKAPGKSTKTPAIRSRPRKTAKLRGKPSTRRGPGSSTKP